MRLREAIATPAGKRDYVGRLFDTIADRYDLITVVLSFGRDRHWKTRVLDMAGPLAGVRALDLACGTGDLAWGLARRGADVVAVDLVPRMVELARARAEAATGGAARSPRFLAGDMLALPLDSERFDLVTTGYGLRNVPDVDAAIGEIRRVLRPGGRLLALDFNRPASGITRMVYLSYLSVVGGGLGWLLHGDPDTYRYIPESIRTYPGAPAIVQRLERHGFRRARWHPVLGGLLAIHEAEKRGAEGVLPGAGH
jgi:demethylmenaquinone methyltransferase/2-methoxy-6-polyprenyl-1,4-benzoquinol methylase